MTPAGSAPSARPYCRMALLLLTPVVAQAQASRHWIPETTVTFGRSGPAYQGPGSDAVALADLGLRWSHPSGTGWGLSLTAGYDFPNEASLVGGRVRITREWGRSRLEGSLAVLASSVGDGGLGGIIGFAFYPRPWGAVVVQLDLVPTGRWDEPCALRRPDDPFDPLCPDFDSGEPAREPTVSFGFRAGERAGVYTWLGSAAVALLALVFKDVDFGCC